MPKKVRGSILDGFVKYIKRTWGMDGINKFQNDTGIDKNSLSTGRWYPADDLHKIHKWICEERGKKYLRRAGNYTIQNLGILSYLAKFTSIERLLKKAPKSYDDAFTYGDVEVEMDGNEALIMMKDVMLDEYTCISWRGVFEGCLEATDTEGVVEPVDHDDRGGDDCYFKVEW